MDHLDLLMKLFACKRQKKKDIILAFSIYLAFLLTID